MSNEYPTETRLYYGIQYWVSVEQGTSRFTVILGQGENKIEEVVDCNDVSPDDQQELFRRAHEHAHKIIAHEGSDQLAKRFGLSE